MTVLVTTQAEHWRSATSAISVGIADHQVLIRAGLRGVLQSDERIVVVGEAGDRAGLVDLLGRHRPEVLLVDADLPGTDGASTARLVRRHAPSTKVIMLASPGSGDLLFPALRAGAAGFLFKNSDSGELVAGVRAVAAGQATLSPAAARHLVDRFVGVPTERADQARRRVGLLTERERDVLTHLANGTANAGIARALHLSEGSVKAYVSRLLTKLGCDNRVQAALIARDAAPEGF
ncbi:DNA-binding response regulator, NarL/FixJ family, contains REC and HTH domains [Amycolatopsis xylanica]|uniref:DNA-binding response regulator, NarL/FixJ family, contains REC and HTH domains n=1 Tax=Amycolatopsis xylanica TaxID=589385 RepID=A0A1H3NMZ4_9PSEU|nr:response regulator transcription factor [Amycolatopsis xylanica]SDY90158.1 DNA-binding response regulator, NarL/FixJ family, contains REC and HTH domains [Amycolatopsis xylanica]